jgi:hypothetical protein
MRNSIRTVSSSDDRWTGAGDESCVGRPGREESGDDTCGMFLINQVNGDGRINTSMERNDAETVSHYALISHRGEMKSA